MALPAIALSSEEMVLALRHAGFSVQRRPRATLLQRAYRVVVVPDARLLAPETMRDVLRSSGLTYADFLDALSEIPAEAGTGVRLRSLPDPNGTNDGPEGE
jgi:hypothetical protein